MSGIHNHDPLSDAWPCDPTNICGYGFRAQRYALSRNDAERELNQSTSRPLDAVAALIMLALTLSWGLNQVSVKLALPEIPPFVQATVRSIGAFAIIALWARWRGVSLTARDGT